MRFVSALFRWFRRHEEVRSNFSLFRLLDVSASVCALTPKYVYNCRQNTFVVAVHPLDIVVLYRFMYRYTVVYIGSYAKRDRSCTRGAIVLSNVIPTRTGFFDENDLEKNIWKTVKRPTNRP